MQPRVGLFSASEEPLAGASPLRDGVVGDRRGGWFLIASHAADDVATSTALRRKAALFSATSAAPRNLAVVREGADDHRLVHAEVEVVVARLAALDEERMLL